MLQALGTGYDLRPLCSRVKQRNEGTQQAQQSTRTVDKTGRTMYTCVRYMHQILKSIRGKGENRRVEQKRFSTAEQVTFRAEDGRLTTRRLSGRWFLMSRDVRLCVCCRLLFRCCSPLLLVRGVSALCCTPGFPRGKVQLNNHPRSSSKEFSALLSHHIPPNSQALKDRLLHICCSTQANLMAYTVAQRQKRQTAKFATPQLRSLSGGSVLQQGDNIPTFGSVCRVRVHR